MKSKSSRPISLTVTAGAMLFLALTLPLSIRAQHSGPTAPPPANPTGATAADRDMYLRELNLRSLEMKKGDNWDGSAASAEMIKQVKEDFLRIQDINAAILQDYAGGKAPDYKQLAESMSEINKRASRLHTNLLLPQDEDNQQKGMINKPSGRSPLLDLNDLIVSFAGNPIFKEAGTVDAKTGIKARQDLEKIMALSDLIGKSADRLSKSQTQTQTQKHQ